MLMLVSIAARVASHFLAVAAVADEEQKGMIVVLNDVVVVDLIPVVADFAVLGVVGYCWNFEASVIWSHHSTDCVSLAVVDTVRLVY